jgi:spore cortex biosynthesis protein YabQ
MGVDSSLGMTLALWAVVAGAFLSAVYDVFRVSRLRHEQGRALIFLNDVAFCAISACTMMLLFFNLSDGKIRGYAFAFALVGFLVWRATVSRILIFALNRLLDAAEKILKLTMTRFQRGFTRISRRIYTCFYCEYTVKSSKRCFSLLDEKRKEAENETEKTVED